MMRASFAAVGAVIIALSAASILRLRNFEHSHNQSSTAGNHLDSGLEIEEDSSQANVFIYHFENDLELQMSLLNLEDQSTEDIDILIPTVRRQTATNSRDITHWSIPGVRMAMESMDRFAAIMNVWPITRAIISMIMYIAYIVLALMLQSAKTHGDKNVSLIFAVIIAVSSYILVDVTLMVRSLFIAQENSPLSFRFARGLRATFARAAVIFQPPNAAIAINTDDCAICANDIKNNLTVLSCGHSFHRMCLLRWAEMPEGGTCPICRSNYVS